MTSDKKTYLKNLFLVFISIGVLQAYAIIGITMSVLLIIGVIKKSKLKLLWWIFYQIISIFIHITILTIDHLNAFKSYADLRPYKDKAALICLLYIIIQFILIVTISTILENMIKDENRERSEVTQAEEEDNPPSYQEAMRFNSILLKVL